MSTAAITAVPTGTWNVDASHSSVEFRVKHLGISTVRGSFTNFEGKLEMGEDGTSAITGSIKATSIDTAESGRDAHLRGEDFFDAAKYPDITFESTSVEVVGEDEFHVTGDLTMHGVTKPVTLHAEVTGVEQEDPWGNTRVGLEVQGELSRGDWGMTFNQALGSGNMMVSDKVRINAEISAVKAS